MLLPTEAALDTSRRSLLPGACMHVAKVISQVIPCMHVPCLPAGVSTPAKTPGTATGLLSPPKAAQDASRLGHSLLP